MRNQIGRSAIVILFSLTALAACDKSNDNGPAPVTTRSPRGNRDARSGQDQGRGHDRNQKNGDIDSDNLEDASDNSDNKDSSEDTAVDAENDQNIKQIKENGQGSADLYAAKVRPLDGNNNIISTSASTGTLAQLSARPSQQSSTSVIVGATRPSVPASTPSPAAQPTPHPTPAPAVKPAETVTPTEENAERKLNVQLIYGDNLTAADAEQMKIVKEAISKMDMASADNAMVLFDTSYNVSARSQKDAPVIPKALYNSVKDTAACELNSVGGCVVLEKDTVDGKPHYATYYIGSADDYKMPTLPRVARRDAAAEINSMTAKALQNSPNGLIVFSQARNEVDALAQRKQLEEKIDKLMSDNGAGTAPVQSAPLSAVADAAEKIRIDDAIKKDAEMSERVLPEDKRSNDLLGFNRCVLKSTPKEGGGLKLLKRFVIADVVRTKTNADGSKEYLPTKEGKGVLRCKLVDGSSEEVKVNIREFQSLRVGLALSKTSQSLLASGVGFVSGTKDILDIKEFDYIVNAEAGAGLGSVSLSPVVLSRKNEAKKDNSAVLSGMISGTVSPMLVNLNLTVGGWYEITADTDTN